MVNFRFHLVSLTAVFLALGLGLVIGSTVVDRVTVETIERQLDQVRDRADRVNGENEQLNASLDRTRQFGDQAARRLVEGRLRDVPVLVLTVAEGPEERTVELERALASAGAVFGGRLTLTERWRLENGDDVTALAEIAGVTAVRPETVRQAAMDVLASAVREGKPGQAIPGLAAGGFLRYEGPASPAEIPLPGTRVLAVTDDDVAAPNDEVLLPLLDALADAEIGVVATAPLEGDEAAVSVFIAAIRSGELTNRVSTVDNLGVEGEAAAVLALQDLGSGRLGHYGLGEGVDAVLPAAARGE